MAFHRVADNSSFYNNIVQQSDKVEYVWIPAVYLKFLKFCILPEYRII